MDGYRILRHGAVALLIATTAVWAEPVRQSGDAIERDYLSTKQSLDALFRKASGDNSQDSSPQLLSLAEQLRFLERRRVLGILRENGRLSAFRSGASATDYNGSNAPRLVQLDSRTYLISDVPDGGVFIAAASGSGYKVAWDSGVTVRQVLQCQIHDGTPSEALIGKLPDTANGERRFYIVSDDCWFAGLTHTFGLAIYLWHHGTATTEFSGGFEYNPDGDPPRMTGHVLHVSDYSGSDRSFFSTDGDGPPLDWKILVDRNGVKDLGRTPIDAERDVVDRLFDGIEHDRATASLGSAKVVALLSDSLGGLPKPRHKNNQPQLGTVEVWKVNRNRAVSTACLAVDAYFYRDDTKSRTYNFTFSYPGGKPFVSNVKVLTGVTECEK